MAGNHLVELHISKPKQCFLCTCKEPLVGLHAPFRPGKGEGDKLMCSIADIPLLLWVRQALSTFMYWEHLRVCAVLCVTWVASSGK